MGCFIGAIIGLGAGLLLSVFFILPNDILNLKIVAMTIGDFLRIMLGLVIILVGGGIGGGIGYFFDDRPRKSYLRKTDSFGVRMENDEIKAAIKRMEGKT